MENNSIPSIGRSIRALARHVVEAGSPCDIFTGTVVSAQPLSIRISQDFTLSAQFLTLTNAVKDHEIDISIAMQTQWDAYLPEDLWAHDHPRESGVSDKIPESVSYDLWKVDTTHKHDIIGRKKIVVHNGLTVGETVLLLREQGGQNYIVLDRLSDANVEGEWFEP